MKVKTITTTYENLKAATINNEVELVPDILEVEKGLISVYPQVKYQEIIGFGGAFTEATGYCLSNLNKEDADEILKAYFGEGGLNYSLCRSHIDSCDFSLGNYSAVTDENDTELKTFNLQRDEKYILPYIKKAMEIKGKPFKLMMTPWSPPAFMKTNGEKNHGGKLKEEYWGLWAKYISKYIGEYKKRGINVFMLSVQNEPKATQLWDSCVFTATEEAKFAVDFLKPQLKKDGHDDVLIFVWDHNKERLYDRFSESMSYPGAKDVISGAGIHWYSGDHFENIEMVKKEFPDKMVIFTEACIEYNYFKGDNQLRDAQMYAHDMIGNFNNGMCGFIDWNMLLDEEGAPNHAGNLCDSPIRCNLKDKTFEKRLSYYYLGHFSKYIMPGAVRIGASRYTDKLETFAVLNPDGSKVMVVLNRCDEEVSYLFSYNKEIGEIVVPANSIQTVIF